MGLRLSHVLILWSRPFGNPVIPLSPHNCGLGVEALRPGPDCLSMVLSYRPSRYATVSPPGLLQASRGRNGRGGGPGLLLCGFGPTLPGDSTVLCPLRSHGTCRTQLLMCGFKDSGLFFCVIGGWRAFCDVSGWSPEGSHRRYVPFGLSGFVGGSWLLLPMSA